jgi:xanthine dehydrogenase YagS FAD-binding subunit
MTMRPFHYARAADLATAIDQLSSDREAAVVAGATELLNWMKEGIVGPARLIDINALPLAGIELSETTLRIGALARMSEVAAHPAVRRELPAVAEALELSASPQLRNMASMGGNLLQRTRCPYFRADTVLACNKRLPGSGCAARHGMNRSHAIFGWSEACVATHPSDVAVALAALDATILVRGRDGERTIPLVELHRLPGHEPVHETTLEHGELVIAIEVPRSAAARSSRYVKVRERASYEFALVSAAAGLELDGGRVRTARVALGGVAPRPWRLRAAEQALVGSRLEEAALRRALDEDLRAARPLANNGFKVELARRAATRAIVMAGERA